MSQAPSPATPMPSDPDVTSGAEAAAPVASLDAQPVGERTRLDSLTGMRFAAAFMVFTFHFALFPAAPGAETRSIEVSFYVDDLDLAHRQATAAGAEVASMPQDQPWGRTASYRDPDGNVVGITQRPGLAGRSE